MLELVDPRLCDVVVEICLFLSLQFSISLQACGCINSDVNDFEVFMFTAEKMILKMAVTVLDFENLVKFVVLVLEKCC